MGQPKKNPEKIRLIEVNSHLTCRLCKGYYIDATTISECLHSFCRSCIIKFLQDNSFCPICEVLINKAKPNLKLDKTLQDIVYKLVPELFLREMQRRQKFYQNYPQLAAKVKPEERGEDTERTIFNPKDTISLSIEYISEDSTPGLILLPLGMKSLNGCKNGNSENGDQDSGSIKRYLQCPGMCRIEVLKKFICTKYNVDINKYYIDILYKRVPLPDHYTLIDIAYIYSWKRNEPMKFFFRISDTNSVNSDEFDFVDEPLKIEKIKRTPRSANKVKVKAKTTPKIGKNVEDTTKISISKNEAEKRIEDNKPKANHVIIRRQNEKQIKSDFKGMGGCEEADRLNGGRGEIIKKIQTISNKQGQPIGVKITERTVKNPNVIVIVNEKIKEATPFEPVILKNSTSSDITKVVLNNRVPVFPEIDPEKSNFLKSIELTAKSVINTMASQKLELPKSEPVSPKRKKPPPVKNEIAAKKPKISKKSSPKTIRPTTIQNPAVRQMVTNVNQNVNTMSKIVEQSVPSPSSSDLQSLFDSCKFNIPSSLSITLKESSKDSSESTTLPAIKPVQNYIEILKLPDTTVTVKENEETSAVNVPKPRPSCAKVIISEVRNLEPKFSNVGPINCKIPEHSPKALSTVQSEQFKEPQRPLLILSRIEQAASKPLGSTNGGLDLKSTSDTLAKLNPRSPQTFQKMFEEAIKKPDFSAKFQANGGANVAKRKTAKAPLDLSTTDGNNSKRNILEIASKLYKKTKLEQEKIKGLILSLGEMESNARELAAASEREEEPKVHEGKVAIPRLPKKFSKSSPQTSANLHSLSLGLNYTVSVAQGNSGNSPTHTATLPEQISSEVVPAKPVTPKPVRCTSASPKSAKIGAEKPNSETAIKMWSPPTSNQVPPAENNPPLSPNQLLEKYNIQNLAQLTAHINFPANFAKTPVNQQLNAAFQHAMILKHFETHNRQNWFNMNPAPLVQYEKYLQSLCQNQILGKEN